MFDPSPYILLFRYALHVLRKYLISHVFVISTCDMFCNLTLIDIIHPSTFRNSTHCLRKRLSKGVSFSDESFGQLRVVQYFENFLM